MHSAVDAYSRLAYSEIAEAGGEASGVDFAEGALGFFSEHGVVVERILTDNGNCYGSRSWAALRDENGIRHTLTGP